MNPDHLNMLKEKKIRQLLIVAPDKQIPFAMIRLYVYTGRKWLLFNELPAVVGKNGVIALKKEGDQMTPSGLYSLSLVYGDSELKQVVTKMPYRQINIEDKFIDDVNHPDYNKWVVGNTSANSYEVMLRKDGLYKLGVVVDYNVAPIIPGNGSAIFLHIWRNFDTGTEGCVAVSYENLQQIVSILDINLKPHILILDK